MDFTNTDPLAGTPGVLGTWHCEKALWRDFRASELLPYARSARAGKHLLLGSLAACFVLLAVIGLSSVTGFRTWSSNLGPAIFVAGISSVFIISGLITFLTRRSRDNSLNTETGEVAIDYDGVTINGLRHDWVFYGKGWRLVSSTRKTVPGSLGTSFEILDFFCKSKMWTGRTWVPVDTNWRVPIPANKVRLADQIADRLNTRSASSVDPEG